MFYRKFPGTDMEISLLGFGLMRLPKLDPDKPDIDEELAQKMVDYAYEHGVNYFDTAYPYHAQTSETFIGKALKKYPRDSYYLATKMPTWLLKDKHDVERIFEEQLEKCQTDHFDFYLLHGLGREKLDVYLNGGYDYLKRQQEMGRIGKLGFSFHGTPEQLREVLSQLKFDFAQIQLNYLDWDVQDAKQQYEILGEYGIPAAIMEPVRGGALATLCEEGLQIMKDTNPDVSPASWAIRYAATLPNVYVVLSGMTAMEHVVDNVSTMENFQPLEEKDYLMLDKVVRAYARSKTVPCTGCAYCMPCPSQVNIPKMMKIYNAYKVSGDNGVSRKKFLKEYFAAGLEAAENCVACRHCVSLCPQALNIPLIMSEITEKVEELKYL